MWNTRWDPGTEKVHLVETKKYPNKVCTLVNNNINIGLLVGTYASNEFKILVIGKTAHEG